MGFAALYPSYNTLLLAMTSLQFGYASAFSRHDAPEAFWKSSPFEIRGRREDRVRAAPAVSCAMCTKRCAHEHTGSAVSIRPSLRNGFTAYSAFYHMTHMYHTIAHWITP